MATRQLLDVRVRGKGLAELTTPRFRRLMIEMADRLSLDPSALAAVMMFETAGTMDPAKQNPTSKATGLIQFMPIIARAYGTSIEQLARMTAEEQLSVVERHFRPWKGRLRTPRDHYLAVFWPAAVGLPAEHVVARKDDPKTAKVYAQNHFDKTGKGYFTVAEIAAPVEGLLAAARQRPPLLVEMNPEVVLSGARIALMAMLGGAVGAAAAWAVESMH